MPYPVLPTRRKRSTLRALGVTALVTAIIGVTAVPALAIVSPTNNALTIANALAGPGASVTGASFLANPSVQADGTIDTLGGFPTNGNNFAVLTTGLAASADDPNTNVPDNSGPTDDKSADLGGPNRRGNTDFDVSILKVDVAVPATANCLRFDFQFFSEEFREYVGTQFNDAFIAELDSSTWSTSGSTITASGNFAFDPANRPISVNSSGATVMSAGSAAGTTYDGATPLLSAAHAVTPGAHSVYFSIFDQGDRVLDSAVFLDNLQVGFVPDPATQCVPGAQLKRFELSLAPASATRDVGTAHTVTATLLNVDDGSPVAGGSIGFDASGANMASGTATTNGAGQATFTYTGTVVGSDTISACYDVDSSGTCGGSDPFAPAVTVEWTNSPPVPDAGGPYTSDEGSAVAVSGSATDVNGDPITYTWSAAPVSGVDAGASCSFADIHDETTTVTCTDDGVFRLTLTAEDERGGVASDTADLTVSNVAPVVGAVSGAPAGPIEVGTPVTLSAPYSDAGSNDTHTAVWAWDDGSSSPSAAAGGSTSGTHTYATPGVYTPCVTVTDDDGGSDSSCVTAYIVVYDPDAGFVTGGGWIRSPAGAYTPDDSGDADVTGRANFGFVSKYKKGATVPTGSTEFQFQAGSLNFHSDAYEWLVVAGHKAMYKGTGTVNGVGGYSFLVSVVDGSPDTFRIKIRNSGGVLYDNQNGAADGDPATTSLAGGSIVIHG